MNLQNLCSLLSKRLDKKITAFACRKVVNELYAVIKEDLRAGKEFPIHNLVTMVPYRRRERNGINPLTHAKIVIPAQNSIKFRFSKTFSRTINSK